MKGQSKISLYGYDMVVDWFEDENGNRVPTHITTEGTTEMAILNLDMEVTEVLREEKENENRS
jgi:hypothetical protein